ncbi:hypothetical protein HF086_008889 [Spodoptera exigua]|uniref:Nose resistant-to-fluoxetine protein N-terminal domain-containing protein n=1 Tax=Spodoptera exigua TaxID=7107 RepID=A0A922SQ45_SPOEX|nr:hypothetical protein HF086_008889 [Spodoptera exigua]
MQLSDDWLLGLSLAELSQTQGVTAVDLVISGLKEQDWSDNDTPCIEQTLQILNNVRNYTVWAVWVWNSMHYPVGSFYGSEYSLGNYDQCLNAPTTTADSKIVTQYCLADITLTEKVYEKKEQDVMGSTEPYVATRTPIGRNLNKVIWGICLPSTCKPYTISKILKVMYQINPLTPSVPRITVDTCEAANKTTEYSFEFYAFMTLITLLVATSAISTYYIERSYTKNSLHTIACAFSLKRNWQTLTRKTNDDIGVLNLLKVGLATLAVATHTAFFEVMGPISNGLHFDNVMLETRNPLLNTVKHIDLPVDNFLMLSGLFLVQGLMAKNKKPLVSLVSRYFSWYIPCDYQLAVMGTILYLLYQKKIMGKAASGLTVVLAVLTPGVVTYWKKLPGILLYHDVESMIDVRKNDVYMDTYIRSHNRAGPYFVGMAMGYILTTYKPRHYRNVISKGLHGLGVLAMSMVFSLLLLLFVEAPLNNIVNIFINSGSKNQSTTERNQENFDNINSKIKNKNQK